METDYYIAQYLYEKRDAHAIEFEYVIDLVKGYFLQSAIYLQAENGNVVTSTYRDVNFYYDTPFLLRLLGFKTIEDENSANELHISLARQKGNFYYFPQTQSEIEGILSRYQKGYKRSNQYTLEGLDEKKYTPSSVERLKKTWESKLQYSYNTELAQRPEYPLKYDGTIDERCVIDESELAEFLRNNIFWRTDEAMDADLESVIGIHKLRKNIQSGEIEHCKAIFVTTNTALANAVNKYYRENINDKAFPLVITDTDLAALTWIKCGSVGDLPERQLLRNAYMAMQPAPEMLEKFSNILDQMQSEGKITSEIAIVLRSSSFVKKEVMFASFAGEEGINEDLVNEIEKKLREESSKDAREDERRKAERQRQQEQHERIAKAYRQARMKALDIKNSKLACWKKIAVGVSVILFLFTTVGLIVSIVSVKPNNLFVAGALFVFAIISLFGIIDFYKQKERFIYKWLVSQANKQYEKAYEELCKEYLEIAEGEEIVLQNEDDCAR